MALAKLPRAGPYTVVYTDVDSSTAMNERLGDEPARELLRWHHGLVRRELAREEGLELQQLGDGFKLVFPEAARAVSFAVALQTALRTERPDAARAGLSVRIGIHTGEAIQEDGDLFGRTPIVATRILSRAHPGQILISETAIENAPAPPGAQYLDRGVFLLKGLRDGLRLYEILIGAGSSEPAAAVGPTAREPLARSPLVNRKQELASLDGWLDAAEKGGGRVVLVSGDPGIGKTRICVEFLELIGRRGLALATGRCAAEGGLPYGPILDWLRQLVAAGRSVPRRLARELAPLARLVPDLGSVLHAGRRDPAHALGADEERARLLSALAELIHEWTQQAPLVLLLDDLQWADAGTLSALRALARRLAPSLSEPAARLLLLTTLRSDADASPDLAALLRDLDRDRVLTRLQLEPLPDHAVRALLRALLPPQVGETLASGLIARSHGNPYFAEELSRDLAERRELGAAGGESTPPATTSVPQQLKALLEHRLERLSESCMAVLRVASLLGSPFRFDLLREVSDSPEEPLLAAVEAAVAAHVLREEPVTRPVRFAFLHPLVCDVLREGSSLPRRQRLHLRIADGLERLQPDAAGEIARHLLAAGEVAPDARIARWCSVAGEAAASLHAFDEAARLLGEALEAHTRMGGDAARSARLQLSLFPALGHLGEIARAREIAERAIHSLEAMGETTEADSARATLARLLIQHAMPTEAIRLLEPAAHRAGRADVSRGEVLAQYAVALDLTGDSGAMRQTALRLRRLARRLRSPELEKRSQIVLRNWYANHSSSVSRALALSRKLLASAEAQRDPWDVAVLAADVGLFEFVIGRVGDALATLDLALDAAERMGAVATLINVRAVRAICFCYRGEWSRVQQEWEHAAPLLGRVPGALRLGLLLWARSRTDLWLGRPGPPLPTADQLYAGIEQFKTDVLAGVGLVAAERGAPTAREILRRASDRQPHAGSGVNWLTATQCIAAGWAELADVEQAAPWYVALSPYRGTLLAGCTDLTLGRIARLQGRPEIAERDLARAVRLARRENLKPYLALARHEQASLWEAWGRPHDERRSAAARTEFEALRQALGMRHLEATS